MEKAQQACSRKEERRAEQRQATKADKQDADQLRSGSTITNRGSLTCTGDKCHDPRHTSVPFIDTYIKRKNSTLRKCALGTGINEFPAVTAHRPRLKANKAKAYVP